MTDNFADAESPDPHADDPEEHIGPQIPDPWTDDEQKDWASGTVDLDAARSIDSRTLEI